MRSQLLGPFSPPPLPLLLPPSPSVSHVLMVTRIVTERERGITVALRSMGLMDTAFWGSYWLVAIVSTLVTNTLVLVTCHVAGVRLVQVGELFSFSSPLPPLSRHVVEYFKYEI